MQYYKVVSLWNEKYYSVMVIYKGGPLRHHVEYGIDKWSYPNIENSKLFVFDDLEAAKKYCRFNFIIEEHKVEIFSCEVTNPVVNGDMCMYSHLEAVIDFWSGIHEFSRRAIDHTVLCDSVKLIERVYRCNLNT